MSERCEAKCACRKSVHTPKFVVVTGGPGAGKTAVLETLRKELCGHIAMLPGSAGIVFGGGFLRRSSDEGRKAAQYAIFHVQKGLESLLSSEQEWAVALCDRGSLDGLAYWPDNEDAFWRMTGSDRETELARYAAVIHLRTPSAAEAARIDDRIEQIWSSHPNYNAVPKHRDLLLKAKLALDLIRTQIPQCCEIHFESPTFAQSEVFV